MIKKVLGLLVCLWLLAAGGMAEEKPLQITVTGQLLQSNRLSEAGLEIANRVLGRLKIEQCAWESGERAELLVDEKPMWFVERQVLDEETRVIFMDTTAYRTEKGTLDALMLLTGQERERSNPLFSPDAYAACAKDLYALLDEHTEAVEKKSRTEVQHATTSPRYDLYTLTPEQMQHLWPRMVQAAQPCFDRDGGEGALWKQAAEVIFTTDVRIKRLYSADGDDMGLQLTGNGMLLGTERKISLLLGYTPQKGGSLTLSARAINGKDSLKISGNLKEKAKDDSTVYTLTCDYSNRLHDETDTGKFTLTLESTGNAWTGKALWEKDGRSLQIEPKLQLEKDCWQGSVLITGKEKKKVLLQAELQITAAPAEKMTEKDVTVVDLAGMSQTSAKAALYPEELTLMRALVYLMNDLPEEDRWLLTHELRTESWHTGEEVPPAEEGDQWIVKEEEP